jgi:hypothetical protein
MSATHHRQNPLECTSNLTQHQSAGLCSGDNVFAVKYERGFYIPEDGISYIHRREDLKSHAVIDCADNANIPCTRIISCIIST